ncbi:MAG: hypothetical protein HKN47_22240 [Pirellulaceae bacterium]|nr:hypothetical protein [Pirellulaceae bacterium]
MKRNYMRALLVSGVVGCCVGLLMVGKTRAIDSKQRDDQANQVDRSLVGTVIRVRLDDKKKEANMNGRLHFCLFDNGKSDQLYVGTKYGMWSMGEFDLTIDGKKMVTASVPHLLYGGTIINVGDVLQSQPKNNKGIAITRVDGWMK